MIFAGFLLPGGASAASLNSEPTLFIHGISPLSSPTDCKNTFKGVSKKMAGMTTSFTGPQVFVGFYKGDTNCTVNLMSYNSNLTGSTGDKISEVALAFGTFIRRTYSDKGLSVNIVAHSMGGLITRFALQQMGQYMRVSKVVTMGSPFAGYNSAGAICNLSNWLGASTQQCEDMNGKTSLLISQFRKEAPPSGIGGTTWMSEGSNAIMFSNDIVVNSDSAVSMASFGSPQVSTVTYPWYSGIMHSTITQDTWLGTVGFYSYMDSDRSISDAITALLQ